MIGLKRELDIAVERRFPNPRRMERREKKNKELVRTVLRSIHH